MNLNQQRSICSRIDLSSFRTMSVAQLADLADSLMARDCADLADVTKNELVNFLIRTQADLRLVRDPAALAATRFR